MISNLKWRKIKRFIKIKHHKVYLGTHGFIKEREIKIKSLDLIKYLIEVGFTGLLIHYALTNYNWISMGIAVAMAVYYIEWFVKLVKRKEE